MPIKSLTAAALVCVTLLSASLQARTAPAVISDAMLAQSSSSLLGPLPLFNPVPGLAQAVVPDARALMMGDVNTAAGALGRVAATDSAATTENAATDITDLRKSLLALAMKLRDTRYVYGGRDPSSGFDCSGFVSYVFANALGVQLPRNSASQFMTGLKISRADMQPGDLVFFRTSGKHRISHVGIYISNGRFIHSPAAGKSVEISSLSKGYWAKRFAGAKRPDAIAHVADRG